MIIKKGIVDKFASYQHLEFTFNNKGLTLISGATGSGKSTLCDIIPWTLFGKTSKNGTADEVIAWGKRETTGYLELDVNGKQMMVWRSRKPNDLFFHMNGGNPIRGKDLTDTQRLLEAELGFTYDTYTSGAYFHEFSQSAGFFTATAKTRRGIIDQLVDLSFAKKIQENAKLKNKEITQVLNTTINNLVIAEVHLNHQTTTLKKEHIRTANLENLRSKFEEAREAEIKKLTQDFNKLENDLTQKVTELKPFLWTFSNYEQHKSKIHKLALKLEQISNEICTICGGDKNNLKRLELTKLLSQYQTELSKQDILDHKAGNLVDKLETARSVYTRAAVSCAEKQNPYLQDLDLSILESEVLRADAKVAELKEAVDLLKVESSDIDLLEDITETFRASMVTNAVSSLESETNCILSDYFDAEIRVTFNLEDSDKIDVLIYKDGNEASYTQLSKGQRQLLKLSFGLSVMKMVQLHNNFSFNSIFLDEALDGFDDTLKIKAYDLLASLAQTYSSVFVVEHNESLKTMFPNRIEVSLVNGMSQIEEA